MAQPPRHFSTAARLHPSIVPHLTARPTRSLPVKSMTAVAAVAVAAYGAKTYVGHVVESRSAQQQHQQGESYEERQARNERLLDMYGDRSSLEALEKAIQHYEKK